VRPTSHSADWLLGSVQEEAVQAGVVARACGGVVGATDSEAQAQQAVCDKDAESLELK
jgi:hypothetical protein